MVVSRKKILIFDFDGVIADSFSLAFKVTKKILPSIAQNEYRKGFEENINAWASRIKEGNRNINFSEEYAPRMDREVKIFADVPEVIKDLSSLYTLVIVSSTNTNLIKTFLKKHNLYKCFVEILGNDVHASKAEKMKMIFLNHKISPDMCLLITDTLGDLKEASLAGVNAIGVSWGFHDRRTLAKGNPFRIINKIEELPVIVHEYFAF